MSTIGAKPLSRVARLALLLGVLAIAALLLSGPIVKSGLTPFTIGIALFALAAVLGLVALILGIVGILRSRGDAPKRGLAHAVFGALFGATAIAVFLVGSQVHQGYPPIHDITTDTQDPPQFQALLAEREASANGAVYAGAELAATQESFYTDLGPLETPLDPDAAMDRAVQVARGLGWQIADGSPSNGQLEATFTSDWFGFKDDVIIRVRALPSGGSRVDLRSMSRVGVGDVGANASRIRAFLAAFQNR